MIKLLLVIGDGAVQRIIQPGSSALIDAERHSSFTIFPVWPRKLASLDGSDYNASKADPNKHDGAKRLSSMGKSVCYS